MQSLRIILISAVTVLGTAGAARSGVYVTEDRLWPDGVVPYEWQPDMNFFTRVRVLNAMQIWEDVANVTFVERTDEADYVLIQDAADGAGSSSPVIGQGGGEQPLFIRQDLTNITDHGLAHELGHVLGLFHTHQRPDRNMYVTIYNSRMNDCRAGNFTIAANSLGYPRNIMDYDSVMSYGECIFSNCGLNFDSSCSCNDDPSVCQRWTSQGDCDLASVTCCSESPSTCRVIEIDDPGDAALWQDELGQRDHLSEIDILTMSFMYPQNNWRFVEQNVSGSSESGSFHNPFLTFLDGLVWTPQDGVLWIQPGTYQEPPGIITKPMLIKAPLGNVLVR